MLLRTVALLLLLTSLGMCATLVYFQTEATKVEAPAVGPGVDGDDTEASKEGEAAIDAQVSDSSVANSPFGNKPLAKIFTVNNQGGDQPETETYVAHGATAEEPETDSKRPAGDAPAVEALRQETVKVEQVSPQEENNEIRPIQTNNSPTKPPPQEDASIWSLDSIRNSFQAVHGYFDSLVELAGGHNGVCQNRCRHGGRPQPRPGYQLPEPNGCSSTLVGFQLDVGIPAMTKCCNQLDACYDICGRNKYDCDAKFRVCLHAICSDLRRSLGFVSKVQACESMADALYSTVWTLGCRSYMNSQRAACVCPGEERDEL